MCEGKKNPHIPQVFKIPTLGEHNEGSFPLQFLYFLAEKWQDPKESETRETWLRLDVLLLSRREHNSSFQ